jgi:hypothetical protein
MLGYGYMDRIFLDAAALAAIAGADLDPDRGAEPVTVPDDLPPFLLHVRGGFDACHATADPAAAMWLDPDERAYCARPGALDVLHEMAG